jgi:hypothetical protein
MTDEGDARRLGQDRGVPHGPLETDADARRPIDL